MSNTDYKYELDSLLDDYRVRLFKSYHQIDSILSIMDDFLKKAGSFPEDLKREDAIEVQSFLKNIGDVMQEYEYLFNKFDE